jgi:hypothetical protein
VIGNAKHRLGLALAATGWLAAAPAIAAPVVFSCFSPGLAIPEVTDRSHHRIDQSDVIYYVDVSVNAPPPTGAILVNASQKGVCHVALPTGAFFLQDVAWREAPIAGIDHGVFPSLHITQSGGAKSNTADLLIEPRDGAKAGLTTIEFHLVYMYPKTSF